MNYIFLDHDGVMVTLDLFGNRFKKPNKFEFDKFDIKCVKVLNEIIIQTDAEIICSSDWRFECDLETMGDFYEWMGIIKRPIGYTPASEFYKADNLAGRAWEIKMWLDENLTEHDNWVAIDDIDMFENLELLNYGNHFIHTKRIREGIKQSGIKNKIINILNG